MVLEAFATIQVIAPCRLCIGKHIVTNRTLVCILFHNHGSHHGINVAIGVLTQVLVQHFDEREIIASLTQAGNHFKDAFVKVGRLLCLLDGTLETVQKGK